MQALLRGAYQLQEERGTRGYRSLLGRLLQGWEKNSENRNSVRKLRGDGQRARRLVMVAERRNQRKVLCEKYAYAGAHFLRPQWPDADLTCRYAVP